MWPQFQWSRMLGASGAIYGIILAYAYYYPDDVVLLYFVLPIKIKYLMIILGLMAFFSSISSAGSGGIAHITHLGGILVALAYLKGGEWLDQRRRRPRIYRVDPRRHPDFR